MFKLNRVDVADLLGPTPISRVTDAEIWSLLISPQTKSLLGRIESVLMPPTVHESSQPLFLGDEVSNLNEHKLYGGKPGFVRFPYIVTIYKTTYGALVIKRDAHKFKLTCWVGDLLKGKAELVYKGALRDRRFDGSLRANDCSLLDFPYDSKVNAPLPHGVSGVEVSVYAFMPGSKISQACGDRELESFVGNPFRYLSDPQTFRKLFDRAWESQRAPGMVGAPIADVARYVAPNFDKVAIRRGYDFIEDAASHYHVAMYATAMGFRCTYEDQARELAALKAGIERIKQAGVNLTRPQESWVCVLQSLPQEFIPESLYLGGPKWMQDNISQDNLWMNKPLSDKGKQLIPGPIARATGESK